MARCKRLESPGSGAVAALLSVVLHVGLFLAVMYSGGRRDGAADGDTPIAQLVMVESPRADRRPGTELGQMRPAALEARLRTQTDLRSIHPPSLPLPESGFDSEPVDADDVAVPDATPAVAAVAHDDTGLQRADETLATFVMSPAAASTLLSRLERLARKKLATTPSAQVSWTQDGQRYDADLVLERARNGVEPDRVVAEVSAGNQGRPLRTRIVLKRLSYAQFTQVVDFWDPLVQLHDDEVVGRLHINSRFNVLDDSQARPTLLGKVSTTASSVNVQSVGRTGESDVFREGLAMRTQRVSLSEQAEPFSSAACEAGARRYEFAHDTRIRFLADGSYGWRDKTGASQYHREPPGPTACFIAARGVTLYLGGVVAGKVLVYSPQRIVLERSLTYARDPRVVADSDDYLGLVCDKDIEVARPNVTGPGDLDIHAALFAKRRFVVTSFEHARPAKLRIYGSLAAGSVTASEPRYATRIEFDQRFAQRRPPGFPTLNRFVAEDWDRRWTEAPERTTSNSY